MTRRFPLGSIPSLVAALSLALVACTSTTVNTATGELKQPVEVADKDKRARVRLELAVSYFERGQTDTALDEVKQALALSPNLGAAYNLRGLIYASTGDAAQADESFARALQINPRDAETLHNRGWFLCQQGRYAQAQQQFAAALAVPTYRDTPRTLMAQGVCYGRDKQWPEAEAALMRAYELDADNPVLGYNLADVLYHRGAYERARFYIQRVNQIEVYANAQTLWLAMRIENRLGDRTRLTMIGQQLRARFPQAPETAAYERGRFDE